MGMNKDNKGFTLIEVLVAIGILTFGLLSITGLFYEATNTNIALRDRTMATSLAQDMMEKCMYASYNDLTTVNFPSENITVGGATYTREVLIADNWPQQNMKGILVIACTGLGGAPVDKRCAQLDFIRQKP